MAIMPIRSVESCRKLVRKYGQTVLLEADLTNGDLFKLGYSIVAARSGKLPNQYGDTRVDIPTGTSPMIEFLEYKPRDSYLPDRLLFMSDMGMLSIEISRNIKGARTWYRADLRPEFGSLKLLDNDKDRSFLARMIQWGFPGRRELAQATLESFKLLAPRLRLPLPPVVLQ